VVCLVAMVWYNPVIASVFVVLMVIGALVCGLSRRQSDIAPDAAFGEA